MLRLAGNWRKSVPSTRDDCRELGWLQLTQGTVVQVKPYYVGFAARRLTGARYCHQSQAQAWLGFGASLQLVPIMFQSVTDPQRKLVSSWRFLKRSVTCRAPSNSAVPFMLIS